MIQPHGLKSWCLLLVLCLGNCLPDGDLCKWMNGRKYYIDVGESGTIRVENATSVTKSTDPSTNSQPQIPQRCSVELITCPSCHLEIAVERLNIPTCSNDKTCRCDFLWIKETAYSKSGREYCGSKENGSLDLVFESKTKLVSIDFLFSGTYKEAFSIQFSAKKNVYITKGGNEHYQANVSGLIQSPNFPGGYPSDYSVEFILQNVDLTGYVQLIFTDFQLSLWSFVEVFDSNGTRIDVYNGNTFRPPAIISSGPTLIVKFQANDEYPSTGFQAKYTFVSYPEKYWLNRPSTDCGGFVEDSGGAITMMNMVPSSNLRSFDCIWLIRPRNSHVPDTQVAIRVAQFEEMGPKSTLTIRQGQHSDAPLLESVTTFQHPKVPRGQEFVVPATSGFYIRLIGYFTNKSHMAIIYNTFRYEGCLGAGDLECDNGRCIKSALRCDGFNHCGDGSDEATCYGINAGTAIPEDANWWRTLTPNYYFPKPDTGPGTSTNTLILVTSLAGLGMFVLTTIMILVKLHRQRNDDSISREILQTISADLEAAENSPSHQDRDRADLPLYDPPPSYDDVVKHYLPPPPPYTSGNYNRTKGSRSRTNGMDNRGYKNDNSPNGARVHGRRHRPSQPRSGTQDNLHPMILKVCLPEETPPTSVVTQTSSSNCDTIRAEMPSSSRAGMQSSAELILPSLLEQDLQTGSCNQESKELKMEVASESSNSSPKYRVRKNSNMDSESCDCEGACSCKLIGKRSQVAIARCSSESKGGGDVGNSSSLLKECPTVCKKRSFKDMMQKGINMAASGAIIPHPASMTITVHPPKSKKSEKEEHRNKSKSDPSSPNEESNSKVSPGEPRFNFMVSHRSASIGNTDLSSDSVPDTGHMKNGDLVKKAVSDNQIVTDEAPLSQVKHLASVLLDGLQQSFTFKNEDSQVEDDRSSSSSTLNWTNLLMPSKKKASDREDLDEKKKTWLGSDTHPLITNSIPNSPIITFENTSSQKSSVRQRF